MYEDLTWHAIAQRRYNPAAVHAAAVRALRLTPPKNTAHPERRITAELVRTCGAWVAPWNWTPERGGIVKPVRRPFSATKSSSPTRVDAITSSVREWYEAANTLSRMFYDIRKRTRRLSQGSALRVAASALLPWVLEETEAWDAWYPAFTTVLCWCMEPRLSSAAETHVRRALVGQFSSWAAPLKWEETLNRLNAIEKGSAAPDALAKWSHTRHRTRVYNPTRDPSPRLALKDGHALYIESIDSNRCPVRAARMKQALDMVRRDAASGVSLDFARLCAWQKVVLGGEVSFRTGDAFAHDGDERYALKPDTQQAFSAALAEAMNDKEPASLRGARAYLDVCFFHPFPDGNGRSARLVLDFLLFRAGLALSTGAIFRTAKSGYDPDILDAFHHAIKRAVGKRVFAWPAHTNGTACGPS